MNERLLDICIKAGINTWPFNEVGFISLDESELVKFAELIVKECAKIADQAEPYKATDLILKHFGVEQ